MIYGFDPLGVTNSTMPPFSSTWFVDFQLLMPHIRIQYSSSTVQLRHLTKDESDKKSEGNFSCIMTTHMKEGCPRIVVVDFYSRPGGSAAK